MRLEIRKGKFLFKFAVGGNTNILPKVFRQEKRKIPTRKTSIDEFSVSETNSEADSEETRGGNGFPPIQVCKSHGQAWKSSAMDGEHRTKEYRNEEFKQSNNGGGDDDDDGSEEVFQHSDLTDEINTSLIHKHNEDRLVGEEVLLKTLHPDRSTDNEEPIADDVTNNADEPQETVELRENEQLCVVDDFVNSEEEIDTESPCEYTYILDMDDFPCENFSDVNQVSASSDLDKTANAHWFTQGNTDYNIYSDSVCETNDNMSQSQEKCNTEKCNGRKCNSEKCIAEKCNGEEIQNNTCDIDGEVSNPASEMAESEGEATETEFDPLEGDEWEGMETSDVTSCHVVGNTEKNSNDNDDDATDAEETSSDFEDLIGQYVTYMPKEISRSVNSERRAASKPRSSASYRRCSSELKRYFCEKCGVSYQSITAYQSHKKTHKTNTCEICFKTFKNARSLLLHSNIHTGENLSTCSFCKMTFNYSKSLCRHIQNQHLPHLSHKNVTEIINKIDTRLKLKKFIIPKVKDKDDNSRLQRIETLDTNQNHRTKESCNISHRDSSKDIKTTSEGGTKKKDMQTKLDTRKENSQTDKDRETEDRNTGTGREKKNGTGRDNMEENPEDNNRKTTRETETRNYNTKRKGELKTIDTKAKREKDTEKDGKISPERERLTEDMMTGKEIQKAKDKKRKTDINSVKDNVEVKKIRNTEKEHDLRLKECHVCIKKFEPRILERHMRSHNGERPFFCDECPFRCSQLGNLNKHKAVVHRHQNSDKQVFAHKCDKCNKRFYDVAHLKRHMLTHYEKSVKHYACVVCKKEFRFDSGLQRHMQLHQDGLRIRCGICDRKFYDSSGLNNHLKQHTCKSFSQRSICRVVAP